MSDEDEDDKPLTPQDSKCNTCKFGLCLEDKDIQSFFQPGMVEGNSFDSEPEKPGLNQVSFAMMKVRSVCFWRPAGMQTGMISPLVFNCVSECSKYEKH